MDKELNALSDDLLKSIKEGEARNFKESHTVGKVAKRIPGRPMLDAKRPELDLNKQMRR